MKKKIIIESEYKGKKWSDYFSRSSHIDYCWYIKNTKGIFSGWCKGYDLYEKISDIIGDLDLPSDDTYDCSRLSAHEWRRSFSPFLDGAMVMAGSNSWYGVKGAWILGKQSFRYICGKLEIIPPKRMKGEERILSIEEMDEIIKSQKTSQREMMEKRIIELQSSETTIEHMRTIMQIEGLWESKIL